MSLASGVCAVSALIWLSLGQGYADKPWWIEHNWYLENYGTTDEQEVPQGSETPASYSSRHRSSQQCIMATVHLGAYPLGFRMEEVRGFTLLPLFDSDELSEDACLQKCCALGPTKCQYLWFFETNCIAAACRPSLPYYCQYAQIPPHIPHVGAKYVSIQYSFRDVSSWGNGRTLSPPTAPNNQPPLAEETTSLLHNGNQPPTVGVILPKDVVTQDSEVVLSAKLSDHQDQGAVEYSWELVAADPPENMNPVVIVTESSTAYLSVLSPGVYTVQLTVKDLATGLSGSAITTVTVLPASSSPPLVIDVPHTSPNSTTLSQTSPKRPTITANPLPHKSHSQPDKSRIKPTVTTTAKPTSAPSPTPAEAQAFKSSSSSSSDTDYSLYMKVGVPVLSIVLLILTASGCIVGAASCVMFHGQNDKK
jgi:hypothetical protein